MTTDLGGKSAIVTGAASGIGRAIAIAVAEEGCRLFLIDRAPAEKTAAVADAIVAAGGIAFAAQADIADEAQVLSAIAQAHGRFARLDILVNNAGILIEK